MEYIVPFSEGGGTDTYARQIMPQVSEILGVSIQINNVPGSASLRGAGQMVRAEPDGYTFGGFNPPSTPVSYLLNPPDDWELTSLRGVCGYARTPYVMYSNPDQGFSELADAIEAFDNGDITNMGGQQRGGIVNVIAEIMKNNDEYGLSWENYVGYDGGGPLVQAVASGEVPVGVTTDASGLSAAEDDRVDVIAVLSSQGSNVFPDVASVTDQGYPNIDYVGQLTRCMWMPGDTPDERVQTMSSAVEEALQTEPVQSWSEETGNIIEYNPPEFADEVLQQSFEQIPENVDLEALREATN
ncbi:ABC transporter substrate-binding protein [Halorubrum sp. Ea1]|nr:ABC transporter substrate-binding protein [Halorubrum sp. Hd13]OYR51945.1 ABC transporter substrate-binding protein [Halorubrum sp. Ea1]